MSNGGVILKETEYTIKEEKVKKQIEKFSKEGDKNETGIN